METAYVSALAAIGGSAIGGFASLMASWVTHHTQFTEKTLTASRNRRVKIYRAFISEASKLYADAYQHEEGDLANLVNLYALLSEMRIVSSPAVVESAERTMRAIIDTYLSPNQSFKEVVQALGGDAANPMRDFGKSCRDELHGRGFK